MLFPEGEGILRREGLRSDDGCCEFDDDDVGEDDAEFGLLVLFEVECCEGKSANDTAFFICLTQEVTLVAGGNIG